MGDGGEPPRTRGGTECPDVPPHVFAMPDGMSIRYDQPDPAIACYVTGYHVYASFGASAAAMENHFLPGTANVRVSLNAGPIGVTIARRRFAPTPVASLYGPTSHVLHARTNGGTMIGMGISAAGWARFFPQAASRFRNQIVPLADLWGEAMTDDLVRALAASDREHEVKGILDAFLARMMGPPHPDEEVVRRLMTLIVDEETNDLATAAARIGIEPHRLRRIATRHFGFPPKMLLIRARFLRSLLRLVEAGPAADYSMVGPGYFDASHFLRDANRFLGMTPKRFMALPNPFLSASLRARNAVLGTATQALHDIDAASYRRS